MINRLAVVWVGYLENMKQQQATAATRKVRNLAVGENKTIHVRFTPTFGMAGIDKAGKWLVCNRVDVGQERKLSQIPPLTSFSHMLSVGPQHETYKK